MAQARKIGREYDITATVQEIRVPSGFEHAGQTLTNDGTADIFWREVDHMLTPAGAAAVLIATPFFCSRLQPDECVHIAALDIYAVCETQGTSTLRISPGRLYKTVEIDAEFNIGNVGLLNKAEAEIDPAESQPTNTAFVAADPVTPAGAVREDAPAQPEAVAEGDWGPLIMSALNELWVKDASANAALGATGDTAIAVGATGSLNAKIRLMTSQLDLLLDQLDGTSIGNLDDGTFTAIGRLVNLDSVQGALIDVPLAAEALEDATDRSGISLWKRMVNKLIDIKALLIKGTAEMAASIAVTIATNDTQFGAVGAAADVDGNVHGQLRYIGETIAVPVLTEKVPTWLTVVVTTPGTPEPFATNGTFATYVSVEAKRADGDNVDDVYIRNSSVDKDAAQGHVLGPGEPWDLTAAPGTMFDLNDLQFDAVDTDDGIVIQYQPV